MGSWFHKERSGSVLEPGPYRGPRGQERDRDDSQLEGGPESIPRSDQDHYERFNIVRF